MAPNGIKTRIVYEEEDNIVFVYSFNNKVNAPEFIALDVPNALGFETSSPRKNELYQ
jgi:hypothetical protein